MDGKMLVDGVKDCLGEASQIGIKDNGVLVVGP